MGEHDADQLAQALAAVAALAPDAAAVRLQTSDQGFFGFVLADVELTDGTHLAATDPDLLARTAEAVAAHLCDLDWDGVVGEDRYGYVRITLNRRPN